MEFDAHRDRSGIDGDAAGADSCGIGGHDDKDAGGVARGGSSGDGGGVTGVSCASCGGRAGAVFLDSTRSLIAFKVGCTGFSLCQGLWSNSCWRCGILVTTGKAVVKTAAKTKS